MISPKQRPLSYNKQHSQGTDIHATAQWVKLSESWPEFKMFDFDEMLKNLPEGQ
jgi:hypothetical protein